MNDELYNAIAERVAGLNVSVEELLRKALIEGAGGNYQPMTDEEIIEAADLSCTKLDVTDRHLAELARASQS